MIHYHGTITSILSLITPDPRCHHPNDSIYSHYFIR